MRRWKKTTYWKAMRTRLWPMRDSSLVTLSPVLSTRQALMEEWHQCLLEEAPEIHMLLLEAVLGKMAMAADTAGMVDLEVPGVVMVVEAEDPWAPLLLLATGDVARDPVLTVVGEVATEVEGAVTSGIQCFII